MLVLLIPPVALSVPPDMLIVAVPELLITPVPVSLSVPPTSVMVPVLLTAVLPVSVSVPSMVMPPEVVELLVSAPDVRQRGAARNRHRAAGRIGQTIAHRQRAGGHVERARVAGAACCRRSACSCRCW